MLFTGWEVRIGRNCARDLESASGGTQTEGKVSPHTDRPRPVNNIFIFFQLRFKKFRKIFLHSPTYVCFVCLLSRTRVRVNEARDRLQTKTKHYHRRTGYFLPGGAVNHLPKKFLQVAQNSRTEIRADATT